jgi:L-amino acid N-acyltransferase YncA
MQAVVDFAIRRATEADAEAIIAILEGIAAERIYTAISRPWSAGEQRQYLVSLSAREAIHVAEPRGKVIAGYQTLGLWAPTLESTAHVGQIGTFLAPEWRRRGIGEALFRSTLGFARKRDYLKSLHSRRCLECGARRCGVIRAAASISETCWVLAGWSRAVASD